ncbi:Retrovirus-related Pol polyprotein from transposon TNT 1-94 [Sesamum angolense]|uniref:Retrovirus-related Pol polyprotein from transposon TNT 1-94 n=1 Tax=Sesamum angolense TaxID=2727404 RepID=A0AAE1T8Z2_9LAMI|nr:Retrovirus-related Pol polyprotein from transposon TNT 1-94 [Sesamum angolense]
MSSYSIVLLLTLPHLPPRMLLLALTWHSRLGHPSFPTLKKILPIDSARLECESCELGRKHRHLLDVAQTIMTHMHVPKSYWGDAILTACYLINRMPSSVLSGDTPYSCLFPNVTLFKFTPFYSPQSSVVIPPTSVPLPIPTLFVPPHTEPPTQPLQGYSYRHRSTNTTLTGPPDLPPIATPGNLSATPANDLPIALRKDGTLEQYKARLVAKGFTQTYGVDYFETFSPVARLNFIRVLFSLAVNLNWPMYQMDIKNAFLYGDLNETIYMEQPAGYVAQGEKQHMVCKLKKAIYGLKQSPRAWFDKFSRIIGEFGFSRCQADHSVFVQTTKSGIVVLAVYVDDILITGSDIVGIEEAKTF